ncbi:unnamed protein product [Mytilus coruscus]|uniref:OB domain-containing protein n=1 Tax=Mytilus coruscus TaxID=42192 RepID=A0A6J8DPZ0_MYTCO|nr:unnamed protein product [Mytilus coruscus]
MALGNRSIHNGGLVIGGSIGVGNFVFVLYGVIGHHSCKRLHLTFKIVYFTFRGGIKSWLSLSLYGLCDNSCSIIQASAIVDKVHAACRVSSPLKTMVKNGEMSFKGTTITEKTGQIKVTLWDELVGNVQKGQTVSFSKCRIKLFSEEKNN